MSETTTLRTAPYREQVQRWPVAGRHILAQFDDETVVVYQTFRPAIARFAVDRQYLGGPFRLTRMSWIKPNFLWMMYRSGWAMKDSQEAVLAVHLRREAFDRMLAGAVASSFQGHLYPDQAAWQQAVAESEVRLQFDPDHDPHGTPVERRAIQLGLRGEMLAGYAREWVTAIEDITGFVHSQHRLVQAGQLDRLVTPEEGVYPVADEAVRHRLRLAETTHGE